MNEEYKGWSPIYRQKSVEPIWIEGLLAWFLVSFVLYAAIGITIQVINPPLMEWIVRWWLHWLLYVLCLVLVNYVQVTIKEKRRKIG